jgi:hypothetical protein
MHRDSPRCLKPEWHLVLAAAHIRERVFWLMLRAAVAVPQNA